MTKTREQQANEMHYHLLRIWGIELPSLEHSEYKFVNGDLHVKASFNMLEVIKQTYGKYCFYKCTPTFEHIPPTIPTHYVFTIVEITSTQMPPVLTYLASRGISEVTIDKLSRGVYSVDDKHIKLWSREPLQTLVDLLDEGEVAFNAYMPSNTLKFTNFNGKPIIPSDLLKDPDMEEVMTIVTEPRKVTELDLKPTAYLSGKITGLSVEEYTAKFHAVDELLNNAYVVINPVTLCANLDNTGATWADYMELCCKELFKFKETPKHLTIFMLAGWEDSTGARVEHAIAKELGFRIVYLK